MHIHSKILTYSLIILLLLSAGASYYRFMVIHDYVIVAEVDCDPTSESCFVWQCDPAVEGECTGDPEDDTWYYKITERDAQNIPACDSEDDTCERFACDPETEADCSVTFCSEESLVEQEIAGPCSNLSDFATHTEDASDTDITGELTHPPVSHDEITNKQTETEISE